MMRRRARSRQAELFVLQTFGGSFLNLAGSGPGQAEQFRVAPTRSRADGRHHRPATRSRRGADQRAGQADPQDDRGVVVVTTTGLVAEARRVIVSAPGALDTFIRFDPILPADRAQLQQRVPPGTVWK